MKVLSLFSGIGAFEKALDVLKIPYELVGYCEIDKYASKSYSAIHDVPETMNLGDITKIDEKALAKDIDLITYGFPCQDISLAGKQKGLFNEDGSQTRSGLFFEALRIIEETQPRVAIAENVKNLTGKKFNAQFQIVLASLEAAGYNNYWQVLNAKDYGIPQNRERVFIVSIRKDIDTGSFKFPEPFPLELRLKDMLEDEVDEKFYLNKDFSLIQTNGNVVGMVNMKGDECIRRIYDVEKEALTLTTMEGGHRQPKVLVEPKISVVCKLNSSQDGVVVDPNGIAPTHTAGHGNTPKVLVREATKKGYAEAVEGDAINLEQPNSKTRRGRVGHGVAQTLTTSPQQGVVVKKIGNIYPSGGQNGNVYDANGISPTLLSGETNTKGNGGIGSSNAPKIIVEPFIVASRGRNPDNPSDRTPGAPTEQRLEPNSQGICNTLTTVQKDNYVAEPVIVEDFYKNRDERIYEGTAPTLRGERTGLKVVGTNLRIRKLTPKECFRLMGFSDEDFAKAEAVNSNTQLYKQAGNSIVVDVIAHIFTQLKSEFSNNNEGVN